MKRILLIINPHSGRGITNYRLGDIINRFASSGFTVQTVFTRPGEVREIAREYAAGNDIVVVSGGDGTLSDVLAGLSELKASPPVGYIPSGTANDMAATLGLSHFTGSAVDTILSGSIIPYDLGKFCGDYFSYIAAFGAFTSVSYATKQSSKKALGHLAYVLGGATELSQIKPHKASIEFDGGVIEDEFVFGGVTNSTSVAGFLRLDPSFVDLGDGLFEIILVKYPINITDFMMILRDITTKRFDSNIVRVIHSSYVRFSFNEQIPWTRDGESGGAHEEVYIENLKHAVRIIVPPL